MPRGHAENTSLTANYASDASSFSTNHSVRVDANQWRSDKMCRHVWLKKYWIYFTVNQRIRNMYVPSHLSYFLAKSATTISTTQKNLVTFHLVFYLWQVCLQCSFRLGIEFLTSWRWIGWQANFEYVEEMSKGSRQLINVGASRENKVVHTLLVLGVHLGFSVKAE